MQISIISSNFQPYKNIQKYTKFQHSHSSSFHESVTDYIRPIKKPIPDIRFQVWNNWSEGTQAKKFQDSIISKLKFLRLDTRSI